MSAMGTPQSPASSLSSPPTSPCPEATAQPEADDVLSPVPLCSHNDWDDIRTRKGSKVLRCRICQSKWKVAVSGMSRCYLFTQGRCSFGASCKSLHVHKKKSAWAAMQEAKIDVFALRPNCTEAQFLRHKFMLSSTACITPIKPATKDEESVSSKSDEADSQGTSLSTCQMATSVIHTPQAPSPVCDPYASLPETTPEAVMVYQNTHMPTTATITTNNRRRRQANMGVYAMTEEELDRHLELHFGK